MALLMDHLSKSRSAVTLSVYIDYKTLPNETTNRHPLKYILESSQQRERLVPRPASAISKEIKIEQ